MIRTGIVGIGFMGMIHYRAMKKVRGARVGAIVSRDDRKRSGDWRSIRGNYGPPGQKEDVSRVSAYAELGELLDDPSIDMVDLCVPTALHAEMAVAALDAGKHVIVEKPMAATVAEADRMLDAARRADRQLMVAHLVPFAPPYRYVMDAVADGRFGKLLGGRFKRLVSMPAQWERVRVGRGPVLDLGIHDLHLILSLCGRPREVTARGLAPHGAVLYATCLFEFDDPWLSVSAETGCVSQRVRPFTEGFEVYLERATISYEMSTQAGKAVLTTPLRVLSADGKVLHPRPWTQFELAGHLGELQLAVDVLRGRAEPGPLAANVARDALSLCFSVMTSVCEQRVVTME